ncbi:Hsp20/alpha crystallin family protein [Chengkuizengella axinellae]|uniref:Hsp20/alpha crystallin family protein n=1 Tax=Chengkuizengella axinellae TaxID=3064388 RepID=A0ABT9J277_9BACL|nr:Hsp20/alpha crystallin family protein [Chengkuizengella sp. 2205SS18-9]MDP5275721.1 Hsp20/alpha crystallin family protein [Chengkuizengella sp. 2205SS18-9]
MSWFSRHMKDIDQIQQSFHKALKVSEDMVGQINQLFLDGPKTEVIEKGKKVVVILEVPGMEKEKKTDFSVRSTGKNMYLKGFLHQDASISGHFYSERRNVNFTRYIPLPSAVKEKPLSIKYQEGLLKLVFDKKKDESENKWYNFRI